MQVAHRLENAGVAVPGVAVGIAVGDGGPVDLYEARAGLDQPPGQQQALAERVAAIAVAQGRRFLVQVERFLGPAGEDQVEGLLIILVEGVVADLAVDAFHALLDEVAQLGPVLEAIRRQVGPEGQVVDLDAGVGVLEEEVGIVGPAEEAGGAGLVDDVALLHAAAAA